MTAAGVDGRIFVVGVPRSGTTLVQSLLAAHSRATSFTESHFFSRHFRLLPGSSRAILTRDPLPWLREFLAANGVEPSDVETLAAPVRRALPPLLLLPWGTGTVARRLLLVLDELALRRQRPVWVEKTPRHLRFLPFLERLATEPRGHRFVHVIRDGLEVVASLHTASQSWQHPYDLETCVRRWNADVAFSLGRATRPNDHFVVYEELTARPQATLERLLTLLDLDWQPEILERFGDRSGELILPGEPWKADVGRDLRRSGTSERALTEDQRAWARAALHSDLYARISELTGC